MATEERDLNLGSKQQVIKPYMFEPNKGDQGEASDDSSEDSGSDEAEFSGGSSVGQNKLLQLILGYIYILKHLQSNFIGKILFFGNS